MFATVLFVLMNGHEHRKSFECRNVIADAYISSHGRIPKLLNIVKSILRTKEIVACTIVVTVDTVIMRQSAANSLKLIWSPL